MNIKQQHIEHLKKLATATGFSFEEVAEAVSEAVEHCNQAFDEAQALEQHLKSLSRQRSYSDELRTSHEADRRRNNQFRKQTHFKKK